MPNKMSKHEKMEELRMLAAMALEEAAKFADENELNFAVSLMNRQLIVQYWHGYNGANGVFDRNEAIEDWSSSGC